MARFDVFQTASPKDTPRELLGQVEIDEHGQLKLLRSAPAADAALNRAIADLNGRAGLTLKLPPGPGHAKFAIVKKLVPRDDPRFFEAIEDNLHRWHNMTLSPAN